MGTKIQKGLGFDVRKIKGGMREELSRSESVLSVRCLNPFMRRKNKNVLVLFWIVNCTFRIRLGSRYFVMISLANGNAAALGSIARQKQ